MKLLMVMFAPCWAVPKDMSGKVFVFPRESDRDHVKLLTSQTTFSAVTTCLSWHICSDSRQISPGTTGSSLWPSPLNSNDFVLFKTNSADVIKMHARDADTEFLSLSFAPNTWHSMCATWNSDSGLAQLWVDGKATIKRFIQTGAITGSPIAILGQEQDSYGGGFDAKQSFIGMITKVHMWDYVLSAAEIKRYADDKHFTPGNVFSWANLEFEITGKVSAENESEVM